MDAYPEDWTRKLYTDLFRHYSVREYQIPMSQILSHGDIPVVDQGQDKIAGYTNDADRVMQIPAEGVIVFGDHTRIIKLVKFPFCIGADGVQVLACKEDDADFVVQLMSCMEIPNLGYSRHFKYIKAATYFLPPLPEQRRIAAALGDMDKLIDNLSKRIEKKKSIKQGAMQELLTGKKRLPGFEGEWEMVRIGNIGDFYGGLSGKTAADFGHGEAQYITFMNVLTNIVIKRHQVGKVSVYQGEHQNAVKKGDLFFNVSSETPEEVAMCAALLEDMPNTYLNSFCCGFRLFDDSNDPLFISYYVNSHEGRKITKFLAQGLTRHNLSKDAFRKMEMNWPKKSEQRAIAKVLGDMDAEIAKLEAKHEKLIGIKKGMMSDLLTGKVRLKTEMERRK